MQKQELIDKVRELIGFDGDAPLVLHVLDDMIPDDNTQAFMNGVNSKRVEKAIRLYQKFHPEHGNETPTIHALVDWLLKRSGAGYANELLSRMDQIHELSMLVGTINLDGEV